MNNTLKAVLSISFCFVLGSSGGLITINEIPGWYATLQKPSFNPPNWLFGPVWTALYIMMGVAFYLVWRTPPSAARKKALSAFLVQFALNCAWTPVFFALHQLGAALVVIVLMWTAILRTIFLFAPFSKTASWLLVPYISWVSFATLLNAAIWWLNK
jgi:tryptophan-rich sensory protein